MTKRRTTYQVNRIADLGDGPESLTIFETNDKYEYFQFMDELAGQRGADCIKKMTSKTATVAY